MADNGAPLILLTRPRAQAAEFARAIDGLAEILVAPLQEIVAQGSVPPLDGIAGLIFTSGNGLRVFADASQRRDLLAWCVGDRTEALARDAGFSTENGGGTADSLVAGIIAAGRPDGPLLHLHGTHTRGNIAGRLNAAGIEARAAAIYDQRAIPATPEFARMAANRTVYVPLFSPRSGALFAAAAAGDQGDWRPLCLSPAVRDALPDWLRARAATADAPSADALIGLLQRHISP